MTPGNKVNIVTQVQRSRKARKNGPCRTASVTARPRGSKCRGQTRFQYEVDVEMLHAFVLLLTRLIRYIRSPIISIRKCASNFPYWLYQNIFPWNGHISSTSTGKGYENLKWMRRDDELKEVLQISWNLGIKDYKSSSTSAYSTTPTTQGPSRILVMLDRISAACPSNHWIIAWHVMT
jgi:hypothetical protein